MDLHEKFKNLPIVDLSIILGDENSETLINRLIKNYNDELTTSTTIDINNLKIYQMILYNDYQKKLSKKTSLENNLSIDKLFSNSKNFTQEQFTLIKDIIILRLFLESINIYREFDNFHCKKNLNSLMINNDDEKNYFMNFIECFVDVVCLYKFMNKENFSYENWRNLDFKISKDLEIWYLNKNENEGKMLVSLLPKLIEITFNESLKILWRLLRDNNDLMGFCIFINFLSNEKENFYLFLNDQLFWTIILNGLKSRIESMRKQAMFIFKIITEFLHNENNLQISKNLIANNLEICQKSKIPFTCELNRNSILTTRNNYILILESLEEKKQNLVLPTFAILNNLHDAYLEHRNCGNCFDFKWFACILEKILRHESNAIVKRGVFFILELNPNDDDDDFIILFTKALNNRFLYEIENDESSLKIHKELCHFLERRGENFINKFLSSIAEISWDPISIFYVTLALSKMKISFQLREEKNLMSLKKLIELNLCHHSTILRKASQKNILITIIRDEKINLEILGNFLITFPRDDELIVRDSESWQIILDFLKRIEVNNLEIKKYICESCEKIREGCEINIEAFAQILAIIEDFSHLNDENGREDLYQLLYNIQNINLRHYINYELIDRIIELIFRLLNYNDIFYNFLLPFRDDIVDFLLLIPKKSQLNYTAILKYSEYLKIFHNLRKKIKNDDLNFFPKLENEALYCLKIENNCPPLRRLYGLKILEICQNMKNGFLTKEIISQLLENFFNRSLIFEEEMMGMKGRATMEYYLTFGKIIDFYLQINSNDIPNNCLAIASALFDKAGANGVPFVIGILSKILKQKSFSMNEDFYSEKCLIETCWKSILTGKKNRFFWITLDNIFQIILNINFFQAEKNFVIELLNEILNEGETAPSIKIYFLKNLQNLDSKSLIFFEEAIFNCLHHGQAPRKDTKIELQTYEFLSKQNDDNSTTIQNHNIDNEIRARGFIFFHRALCVDENFSTDILHFAIKSLKKFKGKRYFSDSNSHRIQQRIFQTLLILEPILNMDCRKKLREEIIDIVLYNTADQPSVHIMMSWILSKIFSSQKNDTSDLWNFFKEVKEKRPGNLKFVAGVILQISKLLKKDDENFNNFHKTAISLLAPECLGPNFNTRLACQIVLVKFYEKIDDYDNLYKAIIETLDQRNFPIANEFYYEDFHLLNNYNLQSIYYEVPRLTNMSSDELISPIIFENYGFIQMEKHPLKLFDELNSLSRIELIPSKIKSREKNEASMNDCCVDLQKKIVPDKLTIFDVRDDCIKNVENESIIVVASLVERIPNLGGIARTCEIFGAGEMVLANKMCIENKEFQSLSVTAEKWLKITEVKPHDLSKYLMKMKEKGWKLIGLEQTANSCSLLEKKFEKKTVLLLGNEKDGIPPNLIPILDNCVEIPQVGVIRSLNVHVTGAICIWEYAKQHSSF